MNSRNEARRRLSSTHRLALGALAFFALSASAVACAAPADAPEQETEATGHESAALMNNGGGPGGSQSNSCDDNQASCYVKCGAIYGIKDPYTQRACEDLCDEIRGECVPHAAALGASAARTVKSSASAITK